MRSNNEGTEFGLYKKFSSVVKVSRRRLSLYYIFIIAVQTLWARAVIVKHISLVGIGMLGPFFCFWNLY